MGDMPLDRGREAEGERIRVKSGSWIEERRSVLLTELVHQVLLAKLFFEELFQRHQKSGAVSFKDLDAWVGTEVHRGTLWKLKDTSHLLFRTQHARSFYEGLFDWTLGSIFHEGMKLKEDVYLVEHYQQECAGTVGADDFSSAGDLKEVREEFKVIITRARESGYAEMGNLRYLFSRAMEQLQHILEQYKNEGLLVRFLVSHQDLYEQVYGEGSCKALFERAYAGGVVEAYVRAGKHYREGGWLSEALTTVKKALAIDPRSAAARKEERAIRNALRTQD